MVYDAQYYITSASPVFTLVPTIVGASIHAAIAKKHGGSKLDVWMKWWLIGGVFVSSLFFWSLFVFAPNYMADNLGFPRSPFEFEIAFANLGYGIMALMALKRPSMRLGVGVGYGVFLFAATYGHLFQQIAKHNTHAANTGGILLLDVAIPAVLIGLSLAQEKRAKLATA